MKDAAPNASIHLPRRSTRFDFAVRYPADSVLGMEHRTDSPWVVRLQPRKDARLRLFCFPHAGAGASAYHAWPKLLSSASIEVCAVQLPGREQRLEEPPEPSMESVVEGILGGIDSLLDRSFAFFGHSMGGLIAFELTRTLRRKGKVLPKHLFISSATPPDRFPFREKLNMLPADEMLQALAKRYAGLPEGIAEMRELRDLMLPVLRADLAVVENYVCAAADPLDCPITVLAGRDDPAVRVDSLKHWKTHSSRTVDVVFPGGHFFVQTEREAVARLVRERLEADEASALSGG
jgi:medium-chain acyl-[acyl-carrier-protein] hydrolase